MDSLRLYCCLYCLGSGLDLITMNAAIFAVRTIVILGVCLDIVSLIGVWTVFKRCYWIGLFVLAPLVFVGWHDAAVVVASGVK